MVVADLKGTLLRQAEPRQEARLGQLGHQLGELFAEMHLVGGGHLLQMLLSQLDQRGEGRCRGGTGRVEVPVFDGGVDAGVGDALDRLQHREETPQNIGDIAAFVQAHGKYLLVELGGVVAEIISFQDGGAAPGDFPFGPDAEGHAVEQSGGVRPAGEDGLEQIAHQLGRWILSQDFWLTVSCASARTDRFSRLSKAGRVMLSRSAWSCRFLANCPKLPCRKNRTESRAALGEMPST